MFIIALFDFQYLYSFVSFFSFRGVVDLDSKLKQKDNGNTAYYYKMKSTNRDDKSRFTTIKVQNMDL